MVGDQPGGHPLAGVADGRPQLGDELRRVSVGASGGLPAGRDDLSGLDCGGHPVLGICLMLTHLLS